MKRFPDGGGGGGGGGGGFGRGRGFGGKLPLMAYLGRLCPEGVPFSGTEICHFSQ